MRFVESIDSMDPIVNEFGSSKAFKKLCIEHIHICLDRHKFLLMDVSYLLYNAFFMFMYFIIKFWVVTCFPEC